MSESKIALPGQYLASCEEAVPGKNTIVEKDDIYATAFGEIETFGRMVQIKNKGKLFVNVKEGMEVNCIVEDILEPKAAFVTCIPIVKEDERSLESFGAVLPVFNISQGYVERIRDEIRIGDILKAKISKVEKSTLEINISEHGYGVIKGFCRRCRNNMVINDNKLRCNRCGSIESRKLPFGTRPAPLRKQGEYHASKRFK